MLKNINFLIKKVCVLTLNFSLFVFAYGMDEGYKLTGIETKFFVQDLVTFDHTYFPEITDEYMRERNIYKIDYNLLSGSLDFKNIKRKDDQVIAEEIIFSGHLIRTLYDKERQGLDFILKARDVFIENLSIMDNNIHQLFENRIIDNHKGTMVIEYSTGKYGIIRKEAYQKIENAK